MYIRMAAIVGAVLQVGGAFYGSDYAVELNELTFALLAISLGTIVLASSLLLLALEKCRSPLWSLMGFFTVPGMLYVWCVLDNRAKA